MVVITSIYSVVGMMLGHLILQKVCSLVAPSTSAASTRDWSTFPKAATYSTMGWPTLVVNRIRIMHPRANRVVAQPHDVLVDQADRLQDVVENAVVAVEHPAPDHHHGHRAGDHRQVEHTPEKRAQPAVHLVDR